MILVNPLLLAAALASASPNLQDVLPGARPHGMGLAYTAVADDPYALLFNPAGLAGIPDLELAGSLQRVFGPPAPLAGVFFGYARPMIQWPWGGKPPTGSTLGAAFYAVRHKGVADKDTFLLSYSRRVDLPRMPNPLRWGASTRVVSFRTAADSQVGLGFDAGVLVESPEGLRLGFSVMELMLAGIDAPNPIFALGGAYRWKGWALASVDLRLREGRTALHPGFELETLSGLLMLRGGVDLDWADVSQFSLGFGLNYSPWVLDFSFSLPPEGLNKEAGTFQMSATYRFGAPPFYGTFIGRAAEEAARLKRDVTALQDEKTLMEQQLAQAEAQRVALRSQLLELEARVEETRQRALGLEEKVEEQKAAPPITAPPPPPQPKWPRAHVVEAGDTLRSIAGRYYGDPTKWDLIYKANADKVERGLPRVGAELTIPAPR